MPIPRLQVPSQTWAKLKNQATKPENGTLLSELKETRYSGGGSSGVVLWDPSEKLLTAIRDILVKEEQFVRKKGSCSHKAMLSTIDLAEKLLAEKNG